MRTLLGWTSQVVAWLVILAVAVVLAVAVLIPRLGGATPYTILTGSMSPGMPPGTLVVVRPVQPEELAVGSVITYQLESGEPTVVTHRVTAISTDLESGELRFATQGDANQVADAEPVRPVQIRGERWYAAPYLGHVNSMLTSGQRQVAVYVAAALLLGYAGYQLLLALLTPRPGRRSTERDSAMPDREGVAA